MCYQAEPGNKMRNAHSLIEMLVVLIIVGVLIAIIVPAVQRSRESARMAQCISHQGELTKAVQMYVTADRFGRYPGYRYQQDPSDEDSPVIGWAAQVFKYLGRNDLDPEQASFIEVLACPSDSGPRDTPRMNYVVNGGQPGIDSPADGIFFDHAKEGRVYISNEDFHDGLTNTILLAENLDATEWYKTKETDQCILWPLVEGSEINNGVGGSENVSRPSSHHPGGFVAAFADGSVKFMSEVELNEDEAVHTNGSIYVAYLTPGGDDQSAVHDGPGPDPEYPNDLSCSMDLLASYQFDDPGDPGLDDTGNGSALAQGGWQIVDDPERGSVLLLDGSTGWLSVAPNIDIATECYEISVWYKAVSLDLDMDDIVGLSNGAASGGMGGLLGLDEEKHAAPEMGQLRFLHRFPYSNNGGTNLHHDTLTASDPLGWHHIRAIKDGDEMKLYFDGALVATDTNTTQYDQALVPAIGRLNANVGARYFMGYLDAIEFRSGNSN